MSTRKAALSEGQLGERGMLVFAYRVVIVGIACACLVAAADFVMQISAAHHVDATTSVAVLVGLVIMSAYGFFLSWVVGRNWRRYRAAAQAGGDPGSFLAVFYPSRWPL